MKKIKSTKVVALGATGLIAAAAIAVPALNASTITASAATLDLSVNNKTTLSNTFANPISTVGTSTGAFNVENSTGITLAAVATSTTSATVKIPADLVGLVTANGKGSATMTAGVDLTQIPYLATVVTALQNFSAGALQQWQDSVVNLNPDGSYKVNLQPVIDYVNSILDQIKNLPITVPASTALSVSDDTATIKFDGTTASAIANKINEIVTTLNNTIQAVAPQGGSSYLDSLIGSAWSGVQSIVDSLTSITTNLTNSAAEIANAIGNVNVLTDVKVNFPLAIATSKSWYENHAPNGRDDEQFQAAVAPTNSVVSWDVIGNYASANQDLTFKDIVAPVAPVASNVTADSISVKAEAGSKITVKDASGKVIGTATESGAPQANFNGNVAQLTQNTAAVQFAKQAAGAKVTITATDIHGNVSTVTTATVPGGTSTPSTPGNNVKKVAVYRAYNPNSGEHLYTTSAYEYKYDVAQGWRAEGTEWYAPSQGQAVYRLYNPNSGEHFYTTSVFEYNSVAAAGWNKEGLAFYSATTKNVPVYREFNPNATGPGSHFYTTSQFEYNSVAAAGWNKEGIGFYALAK